MGAVEVKMMVRVLLANAAVAVAACWGSVAMASEGAGCQPGVSADRVARIELVARFYEAINTASPDSLDVVLAENWTDIPEPPGPVPGVAGMKNLIIGLSSTFANYHVAMEECIVEGNRVVVRVTNTGTLVGPFMGVQPAGQPIAMTSIDIHTIEDGRIVSTRHVEDWLTVMAQIGGLAGGT
jgi:predicted ester cyclase